MQGLFSMRRLVGLVAALTAMAVFAAPAMAKDRNHDGIPDKWERKHGLSLKHNQAKRDQDRDALRNKAEFRAQFDPQDADTDDDGIEDGDEGAGTVASFDPATGELVINVFNGGTVSGLVTDETEIECENDDEVEPDEDGVEVEDADDDRPIAKRDSGPSDNSGHGDGDTSGHDDGDTSGHDDGGNSGPGHGVGEDEACDATALVPGAVVREAEADVTADGLVFEEIELKAAATPAA